MRARILGILLCLAVLCAGICAGAPAEEAETLDINGLKIRPGMTAFSTLKGRQDPRYTSEDVAGPLTEYCPDLLALDLGHNDVSDLTFLKAWPKLRRLIIVDSKTPITDISPLADLNDLEYVELFQQNITDLTPLAGKTHLIDLNLYHNDIADLTPLHSCTGLKRLWIGGNRRLTDEEIAAFQEAVPDCRVETRGWPATGMGWRQVEKNRMVPHYDILMESFRTGEYIPFEESAPLEETEAAGTAEPEESAETEPAEPEPETAAENEETAGPEEAEPEGTTSEESAEAAEPEKTVPAAAAPNPAESAATVLLRNGGSFVYVAREDGTLVGWGDNRKGQLGTEPASLFLEPRPAADGIRGEDLADIQCGNENALFLMKDGTVYTCGTYSRGTQGLGQLSTAVQTPRQIPGLERIVQISCGFGHNAALDADGHVWVWGRNDLGQLGLGDRTARNVPVMLPLEGITAVNCGGKFTLAQDRDGTLWGWGTNACQVLTPEKKECCISPVRLEGFEDKTITAFSGGSDCAFWLDDRGTIWTRGRNEYKQLGSSAAAWKASPELTTVDIPEKVRVVCAYSAATAALTESGNVYIWGSTSAGQLGTGQKPNGTLPVLAWDGGDAVEIAMGSLISSVRTADGKIYVSGYNKYGQLGNGSKKTSTTWVWNGTTVNGAAE